MSADGMKTWAMPAIQIAAAGFGAAVAGPLGGAVGGWLGGALGGSASKFVEKYADKFGESAAEKMLGLGEDSLLDKFKDPALRLDDLYRATLRVSLRQLQPQIAIEDSASWFANWDRCLASNLPLQLDSIRPDQFQHLDLLFQQTMQSIDVQGARPTDSLSLNLNCRTLPPALLDELTGELPPLLNENFRALIVKPEYEQAWKQLMLISQDSDSAMLLETLNGVRTLLQAGREEATIKDHQLQAKDAENAKLAEELRQLKEQMASRAAGQQRETLISLLSVHDFAGAIHLKTEQIEKRRQEVAAQPASGIENLAGDLFELGMIYEIERDWPKAIPAYKEAWDLQRTFEHGFKYAYAAQQQNDPKTAASVYELIRIFPASDSDMASALTNLGIVYCMLQRPEDGENSYLHAIDIDKKLASADPGKFVAQLSETYNNLATLYSDTGAVTQAETLYKVALGNFLQLGQSNHLPYLMYIAGVFTNLGAFYSKTNRPTDAEAAYRKALGGYDELRRAGESVDIGKVAMTLLNYANLLRDTSREQDAEQEYSTVLAAFQALAKVNPDIYQPYVIGALLGQAQLFQRVGRFELEQKNYEDALGLYPTPFEGNPEAVEVEIARALDTLGAAQAKQKLWQDAEKSFNRALKLHTNLAERRRATPDPEAATSLLNRAKMRAAQGLWKDAKDDCIEAEKVLDSWWKSEPNRYGDLMAKILCLRAGLVPRVTGSMPESKIEACALARRALSITSQPDTQEVAKKLVDQLCGTVVSRQE